MTSWLTSFVGPSIVFTCPSCLCKSLSSSPSPIIGQGYYIGWFSFHIIISIQASDAYILKIRTGGRAVDRSITVCKRTFFISWAYWLVNLSVISLNEFEQNISRSSLSPLSKSQLNLWFCNERTRYLSKAWFAVLNASLIQSLVLDLWPRTLQMHVDIGNICRNITSIY